MQTARLTLRRIRKLFHQSKPQRFSELRLLTELSTHVHRISLNDIELPEVVVQQFAGQVNPDGNDIITRRMLNHSLL